MGTLKGIAEDVSVALDMGKALRAWLVVSFARFFFALTIFGAVLVGGQYAYMNYLLTEARKAGENKIIEITRLGKEQNYKVALDEITACIESANEKPTLKAWYCDQAVNGYRNASTNLPQERIKEVIDRHAYVAMRNDVSRYLRSVELERLINSSPSKEEEVLQLLLSKTVFAFWLFFLVAAMIGVCLFLWVFPNRNRAPPNA
jgi:hypothetical protein